MAEHLEILVEEPSAERALSILIPRITEHISFRIHAFSGKADLLGKVTERLRGYSHWIASAGVRVVILVDEDRQDCQELKRRLETAVAIAGLRPYRAAGGAADVDVLSRIAIEELEAWFFGDCDAIRAAYPRVPRTLQSRARFREPDAIAGGTWEALERVLQRAGYYPAGMPKIEAAERIALEMDPGRNTSSSFCCFRDGLCAIA